MEERKSDYSQYKRPDILHGYTAIIQSGCGKLHVTVNFDGARPVEVYARSSASGGCESNTNCIGRLISRSLQLNVPIQEILDQLHSARCPKAMTSTHTKIILKQVSDKINYVKSCPDAIGIAIEAAMKMVGTEESPKEVIK